MLSFIKPATLIPSAQRNCFITLPRKWVRHLKSCSLPTFSIESEGKTTLILSWGGHFSDSPEEDVIYVNRTLLSTNNFEVPNIVIVRQIDTPSTLKCVSVKISSLREWDDLILNTEFVQEHLLNQIRAVVRGQKMPLWLEGGSKIIFEIIKEDELPGILYIDSQLQIIPPSSSESKDVLINPMLSSDTMDLEVQASSVRKTLEEFMTGDPSGVIRQSLRAYTHSKAKMSKKSKLTHILRAAPLLDRNNANILGILSKHPSLVILSRNIIRETALENEVYFLASVKKHPFEENIPSSTTNEDKKTGISNLICTVLVWENFLVQHPEATSGYECLTSCHVLHYSCLVSEPVAKGLTLKTPDMIKIEAYSMKAQRRKTQLEVCSLDQMSTSFKSVLPTQMSVMLKRISDLIPIVINHYNVMILPVQSSRLLCMVILSKGSPILIDKSCVGLIDIKLISSDTRPLAIQEAPNIPKPIFSHDKELVHNILSSILSDLITENSGCQFRLLQGSKGSGKSTAVQSIRSLASSDPYFINVQIQDMKSLSHKKIVTVRKILMELIVESLFYQPSLIILEDIDCLVPNDPTNLEDQSHSTEYIAHMAETIKVLLNQLQQDTRSMIPNWFSNTRVTVLATCISQQYIHSKLSDPQGNHIFSKTYSIAHLNDEVRWKVLCQQLQHHRSSFLQELKPCGDSSEISSTIWEKKWGTRLQRYNLTDLNNLSLRVYMTAKQRWNKNIGRSKPPLLEASLKFEDCDLKCALENFVPSALKDLKDKSQSKVNVKLGGLKLALKLVTETILWPIQYPKLFDQSSMRPRCGILLYGPPGCGKTLLSNTIAKSPLINFISIKGPELLSKYIGKSEQSVRNAFEQAASMKPCVLFFDEFDALAPRRGHDNTGVTDRVVNQFLTEMDGVNGLTGVSVLAATSRPDLIDPALLRPGKRDNSLVLTIKDMIADGRLDKCVFCPMPDESDRLQILEALSESLQFNDQIDWADIAKKTKHFSGADLQSLLATAQVKAAQDLLGNAIYKDAVDTENIAVVETPKNEGISSENIRSALTEAKPSISESERLKYELQHQNFVSARKGNSFGTIKPGQKGTFA